MQTWYEIKIKALRIDESGYERKVNETYLLDAVSYTDAEARAYYFGNECFKGDFNVTSIKQSNITEVISKNDGEWWYKAKISLVTIDEEAGKEKKSTNYLLVMGNNIDDALTQLYEGLDYMLVPYSVDAIALSPIADVFPYSNLEKLGISENGMKQMQEESEAGDE